MVDAAVLDVVVEELAVDVIMEDGGVVEAVVVVVADVVVANVHEDVPIGAEQAEAGVEQIGGGGVTDGFPAQP